MAWPMPQMLWLSMAAMHRISSAGGGLYAYLKKGSRASLYASSAVR